MKTNTYKLGQLLTIKNGKDYKHLNAGNIPVFGSGGYMCMVDKFLYDQPSILLPRKGTLSNIQYYDKPFWTVDTCFYSIVNTDLADAYYLFWYLKQLDLSGLDTGASIPSMTIKTYNSIKISLPSLPLQRRIASILSAYDNLIEANSRRIKILEQMAENLYKEWFVRFRFPGYEEVEIENGLPKGWHIKKLGEFIKFDRGVGYGSKDIEDGENVLLSMNNIRPYGGFIRDYSRPYNGKYKDFQKVKKGDLIMSITDMTQDRRIIGYTGIVPPGKDNRVICTHLIKLSSEVSHSYFLNGLFNYSNLSRSIAERATGANVLGLTADILKNVKTLLPPIDLQLEYVKIVTPIIEKCFILQDQSANLTRQRDLLLPRLMSGQLTPLTNQ